MFVKCQTAEISMVELVHVRVYKQSMFRKQVFLEIGMEEDSIKITCKVMQKDCQKWRRTV